MISKALISDLYGHMEWADARMWEHVMATPAAVEDTDMKERLFHIHFTHRAFLQVWRGDEFRLMKAEEFDSLAEIYDWMKPWYGEVRAYLESIAPEKLDAPMVLPWAQYFARELNGEVATTTLGETMLQIASHTTHHRAQVSTVVRQLGGKPGMVDYIGWLWAGRPAAAWEEVK